MVQRGQFIMALGVITALAVTSSDAAACKCRAAVPAVSYAHADLVVWGEVTDVTLTEQETNAVTANVSVETAWKFPPGMTVTIHSDGTCAFDFKKGQRYVLFLNRVNDREYGTTVCSGNKVAAEAHRTLRWLKVHAKVSQP